MSYLQYKARSREGGDEDAAAKAGNNAKILKPNGTRRAAHRKRLRDFEKAGRSSREYISQLVTLGHVASPVFSPGAKAVTDLTRDLKDEIEAFNYHNTCLDLFRMEESPGKREEIKEDMRRYKARLEAKMRMKDNKARDLQSDASKVIEDVAL